jgi:hypothetical protein
MLLPVTFLYVVFVDDTDAGAFWLLLMILYTDVGLADHHAIGKICWQKGQYFAAYHQATYRNIRMIQPVDTRVQLF